jgi:hypothetical protein
MLPTTGSDSNGLIHIHEGGIYQAVISNPTYPPSAGNPDWVLIGGTPYSDSDADSSHYWRGDGRWGTPAGVGGGLAVWDSGATYQTGTIVLDRGGQWQSLIDDNTNSQPVAGNDNWELVGGTPYVDVEITPPDFNTAPFYDPGSTGPGFDLGLGAPGEGKFILPLQATELMSEGDNWNHIGLMRLSYRGALGATFSEVDLDGTSDGSTNFVWNVGVNNGYLDLQQDSTAFVNRPLVAYMATQFADGSRSVRLRIRYSIEDFASFEHAFYNINGIDQGTKTFTVNGDASGVTGSIEVVGSKASDNNYPVSGVDQGTKTFSFTGYGDKTSVYVAGQVAYITDSTGNDGSYTIVSSSYDLGSDTMSIAVSESITSSTADGNIFSNPNAGTYTVTGTLYLNQPQNISAVDQGTQTFTVVGDQTSLYRPGDTATVAGSPANDGNYTISSATLNAGNTDIVTVEAIPDSMAGGTITGPNATEITVSEAIPDSTDDGWVKQ